MLLFQKRFHEGLVRGEVTLTFRRWDKTHVRPSGRYRCHPIGVLEVDDVSRVSVGAISEEDARRAGFATRAELVAYLATAKDEPLSDASEVFRVALHHGGDGDRVELALVDALDAAAVRDITARLAKMDGDEPWTKKTLALIDRHPRVAASQLAARLGRETASFKVDVRRLKKLGLTQSFEVGYEISPRGRAYLAAKKRTRSAAKT
ncbi:MAG: hypothetical protein U0414_18085 [Polyangiaceae bacterium]